MASTESSSAKHGSNTSELDMAILPPIYILPVNLELNELHEWEDRIPSHTTAISEAKLVIGKIRMKKRAALELRHLGIWTEDIDEELKPNPPAKRLRLSKPQSPNREDFNTILESNLESESMSSPRSTIKSPALGRRSGSISSESFERLYDSTDVMKVARLEWLEDSLKVGKFLSLEPYTVYNGRIVPRTTFVHDGVRKAGSTFTSRGSTKTVSSSQRTPNDQTSASEILERARADAPAQGYVPAHSQRRNFSNRRAMPDPHTSPRPPPRLRPQTTSEHDSDSSLPDPPKWVKDNLIYSCLRSTPPTPPNQDFISQLQRIKHYRTLQQDDIGVRAYSTAIAALAAYPYIIKSPHEIVRLPGCSEKISNLWSEWKETGAIEAVKQYDSNQELSILSTFYDIWGVGAKTANDFYHKRGWNDLDDIVEDGWDVLTKEQKAGVKFYDEFLLGIPRAEVELIASVITRHAIRVRDAGIECIIVGGYRRGKTESGDVDVILSHRDEEMTRYLARDVTVSLENSHWITHTLTLHQTHTNRDQQTLALRPPGEGHGFDSLDKSFVVWQNPNTNDPSTDTTPPPTPPPSTPTTVPSSQASNSSPPPHPVTPENVPSSPPTLPDTIADSAPPTPAPPPERATNSNPHRRVDIIISPWRTVGCAVLGWSGGTTFQRDIRRFVKRERGWKFDSSGVRDRASGGRVLDLEAPREGDWGDRWEDRERRLMDGLGIGFRPAAERCTG